MFLKISISGVFILILTVLSCEYETPTSLWDPDREGTPTPVITAIDPPLSALSGVTKIEITGQHFGAAPKLNTVYFDLEKGQILTASAGQLTVVPPKLVGDSVTIKVVVQSAFQPALYRPYRLEAAYLDVIEEEQVYSMAVDCDENLYVHARGRVISKLTPEGDLSEYGSIDFIYSSCMRVGPAQTLYIQKRDDRSLFSITAGGGESEEAVRFPRKTNFFDFDQNGNIYAGGNRTGIYVVDPGGNITTVDDYEESDIRSVRVYGGYVYVAVAGEKTGIWKNEILTEAGALGEPVEVFDWANSGDFSDSDLLDMTFSEDGEIVVGTNRNEESTDEASRFDPILIIGNDGSQETLYTGLIKSPAVCLCWGNDQYLYVSRLTSGRSNSGVSRVSMGKTGAPYYGRGCPP
jgi:hypothetical protein